jgi:hypothetical protein
MCGAALGRRAASAAMAVVVIIDIVVGDAVVVGGYANPPLRSVNRNAIAVGGCDTPYV